MALLSMDPDTKYLLHDDQHKSYTSSKCDLQIFTHPISNTRNIFLDNKLLKLTSRFIEQNSENVVEFLTALKIMLCFT